MNWDLAKLLNATVVNRSEVTNLLELGEPERTGSYNATNFTNNFTK